MKLFWLELKQPDRLATHDWLAPGERLRLSAMRFPKRRADWLLGRWTAKRAISLAMGLPDIDGQFERLEIRAAPSGEPEAYAHNEPLPVTISISHRDGVALCVVTPADEDIGCDLELVEQRSAAFAADYFTEEEQAFVARCCPSQKDLLLNLLWSSKESAMKALHQGLRLDARSLNVILNPNADRMSDGTWTSLRVRYGDEDFCGCWSRQGNRLRTVVARASSLELTPLHWPPQVRTTERTVIRI